MWKQIKAGGLRAVLRPLIGPGQGLGVAQGEVPPIPGVCEFFAFLTLNFKCPEEEVYTKIIPVPTFKMIISLS
jgi:hypothetical protein